MGIKKVHDIHKQVFKGMEVCRANDIGLVASNDIKIPNCTNTSWTVDNITAKDIRIALTKGTLISHDLEYI